MRYRKGFKYQLAQDSTHQTDFRLTKDLITPFATLRTTGALELARGFAWDGASGPVVDRKTNMVAGAVHDALYRLMRKGLLDFKLWRRADLEFAKCLRIAGAWDITIKIDMAGLKIANGAAAHPSNKATVYEA